MKFSEAIANVDAMVLDSLDEPFWALFTLKRIIRKRIILNSKKVDRKTETEFSIAHVWERKARRCIREAKQLIEKMQKQRAKADRKTRVAKMRDNVEKGRPMFNGLSVDEDGVLKALARFAEEFNIPLSEFTTDEEYIANSETYVCDVRDL